MKNKKNIIIAVLTAVLGIGTQVFADSNNLVQMDIKRSSVTDTVDVTFYTTADAGNSVVTRKSANRYVVLLPNTMSSPSAAPNFGGVKDLITDVDVKHVNDGMGGYTKVTFGTTKPINIKTHMQKTAGLSQEQKDARALIARNNASAANTAASVKPAAVVPAANPAPTEIQKTNSAKAAVTPIKAATPAKTNSAVKPAAADTSSKTNPAASPAKKDNKTAQKQTKQPAVKTEPAKTASAGSSYVPKMKYDNNGRRVVDLEPRVTHSVAAAKPAAEPLNSGSPIAEEDTSALQTASETRPIAAETPVSDTDGDFPYWILFTGGGIAILCIIFLVCDAIRHSADRSKTRLESFYDISAQNQAKRRKKEYYEIINNENSNWQEKYKMFNEKGSMNKSEKPEGAMSYVTDISGLKKPKSADIGKLTPEQIEQNNHDKVVNDKVRAKMLELENSYNAPSAQKPAQPKKVQSEDDVILKSFNDIKLKTFSKPMSLKETNRTLVKDEKPVSRNKSYQDGNFVKLKNTAPHLQAKSNLAAADLINTGSKYLQDDKNHIKMSREKENYMVSSLDEYLSILDTEAADAQPVPAPKVKTPAAVAMSRSGVSNPIVSGQHRKPKLDSKPLQNVSGLVVKSGYNIDSERGFYVVNLDGVSAIVGKIKDNIFVLKKFDHVVEGNIQVRRDDADIYIVRLGKFKCLVNVEQDKMGTLIEI